MKNLAFVSAASASLLILIPFQPSTAADAPVAPNTPTPPKIIKDWKAPDLATLGKDPYGNMVRYGHALTTETFAHIGPNVKNPKMRYAGNNLSCQSCHEKAATKPYAMPWVGLTGNYPTYRGRDNIIGTIEDRVNDCMERSMAGKALPFDGREMKAFVSYIHFLSTGIPVGAQVEGGGLTAFQAPNRKADLVAGKTIFEQQCASCHQANGAGTPNAPLAQAKGYAFPPLWGKDSFDKGAGMNRLLTAAAFIKGNMPMGTSAANPVLSDDQAYDVAAYVLSHSRPTKAGLDKDYPLRYNKPVDAAYPPYVGGGTAEQHRLGPFQPLQDELKKLKPGA